MLNLTIASLCSLGGCAFSLPVSSSSNVFNLHCSNFKRYIFPVIHTCSKSRINLNHNLFSSFLNRAVVIDEYDLIRDHHFTHQQMFYFGDVRIVSCVFRMLNARLTSGGAILSFSSLNITKSTFIDCIGREGGAISCFCATTLNCCSFVNCTANSGGCLRLAVESSDDILFQQCMFLSCTADYFGTAFSSTRGKFSIDNSNFTQVGARQCVGNFEFHTGSFFMAHSLMCESRANVHNGGFCLRELVRMKIEFCGFIRCRHVSGADEAGAVGLIYSNPPTSGIIDCSFVDNDPSGSHTLTVANGNKLRMIRCCFTGERDKEVNPKNVLLASCSFQETNCPTSFSPFACGADVKLVGGIWHWSWRVTFASALIASIVASILTALHLCIIKPRQALKMPQAFL